MDKVIEFLRSREDIKIRPMEMELGLPNATIKLSKGFIMPKHLDVIKDYLKKKYGYSEDGVMVMKNEDNIGTDTQIVKLYNVNNIPGFKDGKPRFKDNMGLWRKLDEYGYENKKDDDGGSHRLLKKEWEAQTVEMCTDVIGKFYIANNGRKIYVEFNKADKK